MKKFFILIMLHAGFFTFMHLVKANASPRILSLQTENVESVQVDRLSGGSRIFNMNDGYEEVIIRKVIGWINTSKPVGGATDFGFLKSPSVMKLKMSNGDIAIVEPAYNCISKYNKKICTISDGEVIYTLNKRKVRLKSLDLYDWILVGWKNESVGAPKDELLEETLYTRYFTYLDRIYADFIMCPKIDKIERINGDTRRHIVHASALNYGAHHGNIPYNKINITLTDTPEHGVKIENVFIKKGISGKEARIQCRRES